MTQVRVAGMTIPVREYITLLEDVIAEVRAREPGSEKKPRIFISGNELDDVSVVRLAEECGSRVVMDDLCTGSRSFWRDVDTAKAAIPGIAER